MKDNIRVMLFVIVLLMKPIAEDKVALYGVEFIYFTVIWILLGNYPLTNR